MNIGWSLYDLSDRLEMKGWQVPTYPLPANLEDTVIHRYVLRADFSADVALAFAEDLSAAVDELNAITTPGATRAAENRTYGFTH
jgi:glutamate decarboxylase